MLSIFQSRGPPRLTCAGPVRNPSVAKRLQDADTLGITAAPFESLDRLSVGRLNFAVLLTFAARGGICSQDLAKWV